MVITESRNSISFFHLSPKHCGKALDIGEREGEAVPEWANLVRLSSAPTKEDGGMKREASDTGGGQSMVAGMNKNCTETRCTSQCHCSCLSL